MCIYIHIRRLVLSIYIYVNTCMYNIYIYIETIIRNSKKLGLFGYKYGLGQISSARRESAVIRLGFYTQHAGGRQSANPETLSPKP